MEEAVRLKEAGIATEIVVVTIGAKAAQDQIRSAMAMGADRGLGWNSGYSNLNALSVAKLFS